MLDGAPMYKEISIRSCLARLDNSTWNAKGSPYLLKSFAERLGSTHAYVFLALPDSFRLIRPGGQVQQPLVLVDIQNDGLGATVDGKRDGLVRSLDLLQ